MALGLLEHDARINAAAGVVEIASEGVSDQILQFLQRILPNLRWSLYPVVFQYCKAALSQTPELGQSYCVYEQLLLARGDHAKSVGFVVVACHLGDERGGRDSYAHCDADLILYALLHLHGQGPCRAEESLGAGHVQRGLVD